MNHPTSPSFLRLALCLWLAPVAPLVWAQVQPDQLTELERQIDALRLSVETLRRSQSAPSIASATNQAAAQPRATDPISRIRQEGLEHSKLMETLSYLTDVIGPRLTGSPNVKRGSEWTRDKLTSWGLVNSRVEPWGTFGRGWSLKRFSAQVIEPYTIPLNGYPRAWSPGLDRPITAEVVYLDARTTADLEKYRGKLKDAIVLVAPVRSVAARFQPLAIRANETNLLNLANAAAPQARRGGAAAPARGGRGGGAPAARGRGAAPAPATTNAPTAAEALINQLTAPETEAATTNAPPIPVRGGAPRGGGGRGAGAAPAAPSAAQILTLLLEEGAALTLSPSTIGDGGTIFVSQVTLPTAARRGGAGGAPTPTYYSTNAPRTIPQVTLAVEDYNRLVRMSQQGEKLKMAVDLQVQFHDEDLKAYNIFAEIPGTDLKDQIVMLGGHFDSWHAGTGATDNGAGVATAMEAVRILQTLDLKPRRTIRIGLWTGEEQGLLGSAAYVRYQFGYYTNLPATNQTASTEATGNTNQPTVRTLVKHPEYDKFSAYFNLDNGTGKIRGVYMQGNDGVRSIFRQWLQPFGDLGASTLTLANTTGTDHLSFDGIGLPGFQFIQDTIEYDTRTHHSNEDVFDRIQAEDLKQAAVIMATFVYNAAMLDEKLPRKPTE